MAWRDYFLWAGLGILLVSSYHLCRQRTLADRSTIIFNQILVQGILICILGIATTYFLNHKTDYPAEVTMYTFSVLYIVQALLPYQVLRLTLMRKQLSPLRRSRYNMINALVAIAFVIVIIANIPLGFISYMGDSKYIFIGSYYTTFANSIIAWHIFNLCYVFYSRNKFYLRDFHILTEACVILVFGSILQYRLLVTNSFGFAVALCIMGLHLTMKNSYAYIDIDTRVFNPRYFDLWLHEKEHSTPEEGLLIIDLSKMMRASGLYSQEIVSTLVRNVADQLWQLQKKPYTFRLDTSIFVVYTQTQAEHKQLANQVMQIMQQCFFVKGKHISCHGTLISATKLNDLTSVEQVKPYINFLLQYAQSQSASQMISDSDELLDEFVYEQKVESYLQKALEQKLFQVYYQPAYSRSEQKFISMEALSRLYIDKLGWISPELFMRLASNNGMILQIMPLQVENICKFIVDHRKELTGIENVKINLTPNEIIEPGYCQQLLDIIKKYQLPYEFFQFEIVESTATQYTAELNKTVQLLHDAGVGLCLDDFGSGYANLNTVMRLPFKVIKLDRSLLFDICHNKPAAIFYKSLVTTFKSLGYKLVAEGVESKKQADLLARWNVDMIQGYYYARPLPGDELIKLLNNPPKFE